MFFLELIQGVKEHTEPQGKSAALLKAGQREDGRERSVSLCESRAIKSEVIYEKNKKFKPIKVNKQTGQVAIMFCPCSCFTKTLSDEE